MKFFAYATFACLFLALGLSAIYTEYRRRQIETAHRPAGQFQTIDGVRLHFVDRQPPGWKAGGPAVVFIHGASGNLLDPLLAFGRAFETDIRSIFIDRPGHGFSERGPNGHSPDRQAELIAGLLATLDLGPTVAVGHSWGASVVAELGLDHKNVVQGLVFVAPATHPWGGGGINWYYTLAATPVIGAIFTKTLTLPIAEQVAPYAIRSIFSPNPMPRDYAGEIELPLLFRPANFQANAEDVAALHDHVSAVAEKYPEIGQPAVIITGDADSVVYPSIHSQGLARDLPNAELRVLEGTGHMPHHAHTGEVVDAIRTVMRKIVTRERRGTEISRRIP
ncbi:alpha/beta hydrolase [Rhizobiales bacterium]|uniref:alpha/beta fold hydrolase n=1 Tax=Hongsoonwoonella zoysiae TaxID=2821844 RepID=UPI00156073DD|nr:alpha/beta hydrolase [Hongsoonwoonella zoysiae]NRG17320.1 alpha/beta hydrolase [Hongsoonwoonella zoysiae]